MTPKIQILQQTLINKIAAGEVIVRPASVVKETVENSFDAGASHIRVEISRDCRNISITDDGCGMSEEDARRSVLRHSTSKIRDFDDLEKLTTRGFRGEALASIISVSRFEMLTREHGQLAGVRLVASGGRIERVEPVGTAEGAVLHVRDLFYNVPARLKFLKSPTSEFNALMQILVPQALSRPEIGIACVREGEVRFDLPAGQDARARAEDLLGESVRDQLIPVDFERDGLALHGHIARPEAARKDRRWMFLTVNGRPIDAQPMWYPIQEAYKGLLMRGRFPVLILDIRLDPAEVDVNVHPTKEEVRFREERKVSGLLYRAIEEALARENLMPALELVSPETPPDGPPRLQPLPPLPPPRRETADPSIPFLFSPKGVTPFSPSHVSRERPDPTPSLFPTAVFTAPPPAPAASPEPTEPPSPAAPPRLQFGEGPPPRPLGQIGHSYILADWQGDLLVIDQHAAHERLLYQKLRARPARPVAQQMLMVPVPFGIAAADHDLIEPLLPLLREMGMEIQERERGYFAVTALPADCDDLDAPALVRDVLDDLRREENEPARMGVDELRDRVLIRMACHAAIKAGQILSPEEMQRLVDELVAARLSFTCPHGRPTIVRLTKDQIDRQFGRKG